MQRLPASHRSTPHHAVSGERLKSEQPSCYTNHLSGTCVLPHDPVWRSIAPLTAHYQCLLPPRPINRLPQHTHHPLPAHQLILGSWRLDRTVSFDCFILPLHPTWPRHTSTTHQPFPLLTVYTLEERLMSRCSLMTLNTNSCNGAENLGF